MLQLISAFMKKIVLVLAIVTALAAPAFGRDVVVMIYDSETAGIDNAIFHEEAPIFKSYEWFKDTKGKATTLKKMYANGWRIVGFSSNAKQSVIILQRD